MSYTLKLKPDSKEPIKIYEVLQKVFPYLSVADLRNTRLVNRDWNFASVSELIRKSRNYTPPALKINNSEEPGLVTLGWYIEFENVRRKCWKDLYNDGCPILQFHHLHLVNPKELDFVSGFTELSWRDSVTHLSLTVDEVLAEVLLINWLLPSFSGLKNLSCIIQSDGLRQKALDVFAENPKNSRKNHQVQLSSCSFYYFAPAGSFPCKVLDACENLQSLTLEFSDAISLLNAAEKMAFENRNWIVQTLQVRLTHKERLNDQVLEPELHTEAFAISNAKICNTFTIQKSLEIGTLIPTGFFFAFLKELSIIRVEQVQLEIAIPREIERLADRHVHNFFYFLGRAINLRFPIVSDLKFTFAQYYCSATPIPLRQWILSDFPETITATIKTMSIRTIPATYIPITPRHLYVTVPFAQRSTLWFSWWFQELTELVVDACEWSDFMAVVDSVTQKLARVETIVFRGSSVIDTEQISGWCFFPVTTLKKYSKRLLLCDTPEHYIGLQGAQSLKLIRFEGVGVSYTPLLSSVFENMPHLESIHLDPDWNTVVPANSFRSRLNNVICKLAKETSTWPSSVAHVQVRTT